MLSETHKCCKVESRVLPGSSCFDAGLHLSEDWHSDHFRTFELTFEFTKMQLAMPAVRHIAGLPILGISSRRTGCRSGEKFHEKGFQNWLQLQDFNLEERLAWVNDTMKLYRCHGTLASFWQHPPFSGINFFVCIWFWQKGVMHLHLHLCLP